MIFLGPVYKWLEANYAVRIHHFPLIRLVTYSVDKTILYLLLFVVLRALWLWHRHKKVRWGHELLVFVFAAYVILLLFLTVFRGVYYPWQITMDWGRKWHDANTVILAETWKLRLGLSHFDFYYQSLGNVGWFVPFGLLLPLMLRTKHKAVHVIFWGILLSLFIETMQFYMHTGIADIDDVIFNTTGALIGSLMYVLLHRIRLWLTKIVNRAPRK
ncbi:VanZ family protein [Lacticaseibacillus hulanensis]|uniref:VanZ family protein n=1 Tax=Lacticaseibacillus hulanensis TaxID=2493111 RepID=UPI000FDBB8C8|nr:VanZ family protein [Lacticaseibacillus hulanensis]